MSKKDETMKYRHYLWAIFGGLLFTVLGVIIYATWQEYRNIKNGGQWRWKDWLCLVGCGMIGQTIQAFIIYLNVTY